MNLALHGFLLQVIVSLIDFQYGFRLCSAGEPGYLDFDNLPETNFSCQGKVIGGYYADVETGCQMFHVCTVGQKDEIMDIKFLCLNGTVFDQETRVCERVDEVDCSKSERFYNLNLELYGNNAVTLSLHDNSDDDGEPTEAIDDHQLHTTSARPSTTTTTTTTTTKPPTTQASYQPPTGYPHHFQPQPPFPSVQTSQSKLRYDDKNGGFHHQYIFHSGERTSPNQATSYQIFSNQRIGSTTTVTSPQVHQIRYSSTPNPQIIHNEHSTVAPIFRTSSSTIQTLLNSNANNPALINPLFHNHGIASTTEQFSVHSNNPRETSEYEDEDEEAIEVEDEDEVENNDEEDSERQDNDRRPLEAIQPTSKGKVSKLTIAPVPPQQSAHQSSSPPPKSTQDSQQPKVSNFQPTSIPLEPTVRSFYPTPRTSPKPQSTPIRIPQHIHVPPPPSIPQLKPHQITINLPPPDIQRIVQNPSPLLPSQSRVIVTAKASVSDESGRPLNTTQLVTLPLPTIPASYDDYREGDESFDPFYRDVPKIRNARRVYEHLGAYILGASLSKGKSSVRSKRETTEDSEDHEYEEENRETTSRNLGHEHLMDDSFFDDTTEIMDIKGIKANLKKFKAILLGRHTFTDSGEKGSKNLSTEKLESDDSSSRGKSNKDIDSKMMDDTFEEFDDDDDGDDDDEDGDDEDHVLEKITRMNESETMSVTKAYNAAVTINSTTKGTDVEEPIDHKVALNDEESDAVNDSIFKSISNIKRSDVEDDLESKSTRFYVPNDSERKSTLNTKISDSEEYVEFKSQLNSKESDAEEYVEPEHMINIENSDDQKSTRSKSILNSKESDAEEYIESNPVLNSKESDAEEYIGVKSVLKASKSDVEETVELKPILNSTESDAGEYLENNSDSSSKNINVEEHTTVKYISSKEMPDIVINRETESMDKKIDDEMINRKSLNTVGSNTEKDIEHSFSTNSKKFDFEEYDEPESTLIVENFSTEPNFVSITKKFHSEEYMKTESSENDGESDVEEIHELKFATNTEGSDAEEYIEFKSVLNTKKTNAEDDDEPESISSESKSNVDDAEQAERKHIENTKAALDSKKLNITEYTESKFVLNTNDTMAEEHAKIDKSVLKPKEIKKNLKLESEKDSNDEDDTEDVINEASGIIGKAVSKNVEESHNEENRKTTLKKFEMKGQADSKSVKGVTRDSKKPKGAKTVNSNLRLDAPKLKFPTRRPSLVSFTNRKGDSFNDGGPTTDKAQSKSKEVKKSTSSLKNLTEKQIDTQIFEEPESQTSKEVDARAAAQYESTLSKSDVDGRKGKNDLVKSSKIRSSIRGSKKGLLEEDKPEEKMSKDKVKDLTDGEEASTMNEEELEASTEDIVSPHEEDYVSGENASYDSGSRQYSGELSDDKSNESLNKMTSNERNEEASSIENPFHEEDRTMKIGSEKDEEYEGEYGSQELSPNTGEEVDSAEQSNSNDSLLADSREIDPDYDYVESRSNEDATTSAEYVGSEEDVTNSQEEPPVENDEPTLSDDNDQMDVLKFTDELPSTGKEEEDASNDERVEPMKDTMQDYIDDNYEPVHYKEGKKATRKEEEETLKKEKKPTLVNLGDANVVRDKADDYVNDNDEPAHYKEGKKETRKEEKKPTLVNLGDANVVKGTTDDYVNDNDEPARYKEKKMKKSLLSTDLKDEKKVKSSELELSKENQKNETKKEDGKVSTDKSISAKESDAIAEGSFEEEATTTTSMTTTTTPRPTPPKLFKPASVRKSYNYVPPTTTPNPVVIKPRLGLFNPKPSKPQKTYNDIAPKPVIRKHPLLARKMLTARVGTTTTKSEPVQKRLDEIESSTEIIDVSTEIGAREENILDNKTEYTDQKTDQVDHSVGTQPLETAPLLKSKDERISRVEDVPSTSTESDEVSTVTVETTITNAPYTLLKASTIARDPEENQQFGINAIPDTRKLTTAESIAPSTDETTTDSEGMTTMLIETVISVRPEVTLVPPEPGPDLSHSSTTDSKFEITSKAKSPPSNIVSTLELTSVRSTNRKSSSTKRQGAFNCLEKEMYRFYGDARDCRLFHYCSPGFTSRQVLDFRFVCEEGTAFDEASQSCRHDVKSTKCVNRLW